MAEGTVVETERGLTVALFSRQAVRLGRLPSIKKWWAMIEPNYPASARQNEANGFTVRRREHRPNCQSAEDATVFLLSLTSSGGCVGVPENSPKGPGAMREEERRSLSNRVTSQSDR